MAPRSREAVTPSVVSEATSSAASITSRFAASRTRTPWKMSSASEPSISWTVPTLAPSLANTGLPYRTPRQPTGSAIGCLLRGGGSAAAPVAEFLQELDLQPVDIVGRFEAEALGVERQLRAERA